MADHKPDEKLIAGYYNWNPCYTRSVWKDEPEELLLPFFSRFACQTCGSELAGDRYYATATEGKNITDKREQFEICVDCFVHFFM